MSQKTDEPAGFAICECGYIIFFGGCDECGLSEDELTFHSADSTEKTEQED